MNVMLDTSAVMALLEGVPGVRVRVGRVLREQGKVLVSALVYYEMLRGLSLEGLESRRHQLESLMLLWGITPLDASVMDEAIAIYRYLQERGLSLGDADIMIAASAVRENALLVTGYPEQYQIVPHLRVESWGAGVR